MNKIIKKWIIHPIKRRIAKFYLFVLRRFTGIKVIGITGSAGKTTTKEMLASILKLQGKTVYTLANIDPIYNIPTTILKCTPKTRYLILEMGVEYPGEMDFYLWLARPDVGVITNIYPTHTEFLGDVGGVFKEKSKLVMALSKDNWAILSIEDEKLKKMKGKLSSKIIWFGEDGFIKANNIKFANNSTEFDLYIGKNNYKTSIPIYGRHFVANALAATATAFSLGINFEKIVKGLGNFQLQEHRMKVIRQKSGVLVVDDTYNNNPSAAKETLKTFIEIAKERKKLVVMGDMLELGKLEKSEHVRLGKKISDLGIDFLIGVGKASQYMVEEAKENMGNGNVLWLEDKDSVLKHLKPFLNKNWSILIKGSRSVGLDEVVNRL
jgi:UDP-N-acetylmuramoyl-tripeptide--D-alanyl-D-alanine ligase